MSNYSKNVRMKIFSITGGKCFYCGEKLSFDNFHVDHLNPRSNDGIDINNRVPSCQDCNLIKSNKSVEEFRKTIENYLVDDTHVRLVLKYMGVKKTSFRFYFEKHNFKPV